MPRGKKLTAEQITGKLREAEVGLAQGKTVPEVVRMLTAVENGGAGRFEKPAPDARAAPPEAHESLISPKTVAEVPFTGLSLKRSTGPPEIRLPSE